jgi:hypothetical protein
MPEVVQADKRAEKFIKRYETLLGDASTYRSVCQQLADFIAPNKVQVIKQRAKGARTTQEVFEGTAIRSNNSLASFIAGTLTNLSVRVFSLVVEEPDLKKDKSTMEWLEDTTNRIISYLRRSNFGTESQELYRDLGGFGTGCLLFDERRRDQVNRFNGFMFRAEPVGAYVIAENPEGFADTLYRKLQLSPVQMAQRWGDKALPEQAFKKLNTTDQDVPREVIHAVEPNVRWRGGLLKTNKAWSSIFIDKEAKHIIAEGGYHEFPFMVPRWAKMSGETYGRGPGHDAYPDIRTLNKAMEMMFRAWAKSIDPPLNVLDDSVVGNVINQIPSGINIVRDLNAIQVWDSKNRFQMDQQLVPDLRQAIRDTFYVNQFQLPDKTIITATEVERRLELMQQVLGPVVGRLETEYLAPLVQRALRILHRANQLAPIPPKLMEFIEAQGGIEFSIKYEGPLARSQRQADIAAVERFLTLITPAAQVQPTIIDNIDWDEMARFLADTTGVPQKLILAAMKVKQIRDDRAAQQQAMNDAAMQEQGSKVAQNLAGAAAAISGAQAETAGAPNQQGMEEAA